MKVIVCNTDLVNSVATVETFERLRELSRSNVIVFSSSKRFKDLDDSFLSKIKMPTRALWFVLAEDGSHCLGMTYIETKCLWQYEVGNIERLLKLRGYTDVDVVPFVS